VHEAVPGARVLYTDLDPEIVAAGRALLDHTPGVAYVAGDAADPRGIGIETLDSALPGWRDRPVGVIFLGLAAFLDDPTLARALEELYDLVPVGSRLAFDFDAMELAAYPQALAMMGPGFHMREAENFGALLGRWKLTDDGIVPVARWRPDGPVEQVPDAFWGGLATK
jgi:O-methyltransferase involved in polyketide biosynthesis